MREVFGSKEDGFVRLSRGEESREGQWGSASGLVLTHRHLLPVRKICARTLNLTCCASLCAFSFACCTSRHTPGKYIHICTYTRTCTHAHAQTHPRTPAVLAVAMRGRRAAGPQGGAEVATSAELTSSTGLIHKLMLT